MLRAWEVAIDKTGGYLYSRALLALVSSLFHGIAFSIVGVPYPVALALWVGLVSQFLPVIGTYLAGVLPMLRGAGERAGEGHLGRSCSSPSTSRSRTTCSPRASRPAPWS